MNHFRIIPLKEAYANKIRKRGKDDFGNTVVEQLASGKGPCRVSLRLFCVGKDKRLLFSYSPFEMKNAYNQPGPVFIHKGKVNEYADVFRFPPEIKADKEHFPLTLIGYNKDQKMITTNLVGEQDVDELINGLLSEYPELEYLHARNAETGCFICKIARNR